MEACRVLAHCLKDKHKPESQALDWSRWMQKACEEAIEALENSADVKALKKPGSRQDWGTHRTPPPGHVAPGDPGS